MEDTAERFPLYTEQPQDGTVTGSTQLQEDTLQNYSNNSFNQLQEDYNILNIKYSSSLESISKLQQNLQTQNKEIISLRKNLTASQQEIERLLNRNQALEKEVSNEDSRQKKILCDTCQEDLTNLNKKMIIIRKKLQYISNILKRKMGKL